MTVSRKNIFALLATLALTACGGGGSSDDDDDGFGGNELMPAIAESAYADVLVACVSALSASESCALTTLPLIGQQTTNPTVDNIMARTVVSHDWMGVRFRQYLEEAPAEIIELFSAVTAVVIAWDVRPSFYTVLTGGIYLDPAYLWLTQDEQATISTDPDYRAGFGSELQFSALARYLKDNAYAWRTSRLAALETRTIAEILQPTSALLLHELAHANDVFPPAQRASVDQSLTVLDAAISLEETSVSAQLENAQPLNSVVWLGLAEVLYQGRPASFAERSLTATDAGLDFETDGASDAYAYSTTFEDTAMMFEEVMMKHLFDVDREIAFTNSPAGEDARYCDSYLIAWGFRNRVNEPLVRARATLILNQLLDETDVSPYLADFDTPQRLTNGVDWCTIQNLSGAPEIFASPSSVGQPTERELLPQEDLIRLRH